MRYVTLRIPDKVLLDVGRRECKVKSMSPLIEPSSDNHVIRFEHYKP